MTWFDVADKFNSELGQGPILIQLWVLWLSIVATISIAFASRQPVARVILGAWVLNCCLSMYAYAHVGMARPLGAVHFVFMAPAIAYAWQRLPALPRDAWHTKWLRVFGASWVVSLWIDAADVVRWIAGRL